jgi:hypothetical protein
MAAINKIEVTSLLLTETIIARAQALLSQFSLFGCLLSGKFLHAPKRQNSKRKDLRLLTNA